MQEPALAPAHAPDGGRAQRVKAGLVEHWKDPLYRNSYLLMANTLVITGSGFVFWLIAARLAAPDEVGLATSVVSAMMLVSLLARLGFDVALLRQLPRMEGPAAHKLINSTFTVSALAALVGGLVFALGTPLWSPSLARLSTWTFAAGFAALAMIWSTGTLLDTVFTARRRSDFVLYKNTLHSILKILLLVALATLLGATGIVVGWTASMLLAAGVAALFWLRKAEADYVPRVGIDRAAMRGILSTSFANYAVSVILVMPQSVGSLIVLHRFGAAAAGNFYVLWMFGSISLAAPSMLGQSSLVEMSHSGKTNVLHLGRALLISAAAAIGMLLAGFVLLPLFGAFYARHPFASLLPYTLAALPGTVIYARLALMRAEGRHVPLIATAAVLVVCFTAGVALIPGTLGVTGVGWVWFAALGIATMASYSTPATRAKPGSL